MENICVKDIMQDEIIVVSGDSNLRELDEHFNRYHISGFVVVDADEKLIGVVSLRDLVEFSKKSLDIYQRNINETKSFYHDFSHREIFDLDLELRDDVTVKEIMTPVIMCVEESDSVAQAAKTMVESGVHRLIVVKQNNVVGIITTMDIVKVVANN